MHLKPTVTTFSTCLTSLYTGLVTIALLKNKNPHRLTVVIIPGSRQQKLKRKPNHITTLSSPQMYIMHMLRTCTAHVLQHCLTCILYWLHIMHMMSTCTPALSNLYPWFDYISWKHGCPETTASYPTSQRQSPRTYTLQANMNLKQPPQRYVENDEMDKTKVKIQLSPAMTVCKEATGRSWAAWVPPAEASRPGFDCKQLITFHSPLICLVTSKYLSSGHNRHHWCRKWMNAKSDL